MEEKWVNCSVNIRAILLWMLYFRYGLLLYKSILPQPLACVGAFFPGSIHFPSFFSRSLP